MSPFHSNHFRFQFLNVATKFMRIFNLVLLMLLLGHWNACLQFLIPLLQDIPPYSWVAVNELQVPRNLYLENPQKMLLYKMLVNYDHDPIFLTTQIFKILKLFRSPTFCINGIVFFSLILSLFTEWLRCISAVVNVYNPTALFSPWTFFNWLLTSSSLNSLRIDPFGFWLDLECDRLSVIFLLDGFSKCFSYLYLGLYANAWLYFSESSL